MTPKEKARKLVSDMLDKLYADGSFSFKRILRVKAIECAKVTVEEMILNDPCLPIAIEENGIEYTWAGYWNAVKSELNMI